MDSRGRGSCGSSGNSSSGHGNSTGRGSSGNCTTNYHGSCSSNKTTGIAEHSAVCTAIAAGLPYSTSRPADCINSRVNLLCAIVCLWTCRNGSYAGHSGRVLQLLVLGEMLLSLGKDRQLLAWKIGEYDAPQVGVTVVGRWRIWLSGRAVAHITGLCLVGGQVLEPGQR